MNCEGGRLRKYKSHWALGIDKDRTQSVLRTACSTAAFHHAGRLTEGSNESDTRHLGVSHLVRVWFSTRQSGLRVRPGAERQMESGVEGIGHYSDALYTNTCPAIVTDLIAPDGVQLKRENTKVKRTSVVNCPPHSPLTAISRRVRMKSNFIRILERFCWCYHHFHRDSFLPRLFCCVCATR